MAAGKSRFPSGDTWHLGYQGGKEEKVCSLKTKNPGDFVAKLRISVKPVWAAVFKYLLLGQF